MVRLQPLAQIFSHLSIVATAREVQSISPLDPNFSWPGALYVRRIEWGRDSSCGDLLLDVAVALLCHVDVYPRRLAEEVVEGVGMG